MSDTIISQFERTYNRPLEVNETRPDLSTRDAIAGGVRYQGMTCYVESENQTYQLQGGTENINWVQVTRNGVNGSFTTTDGKTVTVTDGLISSIV